MLQLGRSNARTTVGLCELCAIKLTDALAAHYGWQEDGSDG
jgi:hypothetical protein